MNEIEKLSNSYARDMGDDCLCQRTNTGTHVGEHIYCFCGCNMSEAFRQGFRKARELIGEALFCRGAHCDTVQFVYDYGTEHASPTKTLLSEEKVKE